MATSPAIRETTMAKRTATKRARKKTATKTTKTAGKRAAKTVSFTAERDNAARILKEIVEQYAPFRYRGIREKRGHCACGGLAVTRLIFTGKYGKKLLLHENCARDAGLKMPSN